MHTAVAVDVVVIGGGIVGTSAAAFLSAAGASVLLVERDGLASGASGANSGVVQHPFDPVLAALYRETVSLYRELAAVSNSFRVRGSARRGCCTSVPTRPPPRPGAADRGGVPVAAASRSSAARPCAGSSPRPAPDLWACRVDIGYPVMPGASTYAYATLAESRGAVVRMGRAASLEIRGRRGHRASGSTGSWCAPGPCWSPPGRGRRRSWTRPARWSPIRARWGVVVEAELAAPPDARAGGGGDRGCPGRGGGTAGASGEAGGVAGVPRTPEPTPDGGGVEFSLVPLPGRRGGRVHVPAGRARPRRLDGGDPRAGIALRPGRRRRADPRRPGLRPAAERRRAAARGDGSRHAEPVRVRGPRPVGDLHRAGVGAAGRGPRPGRGPGSPLSWTRPGSGRPAAEGDGATMLARKPGGNGRVAGAHGSRTHRATPGAAPPVLKTGRPTGTPPLPRIRRAVRTGEPPAYRAPAGQAPRPMIPHDRASRPPADPPDRDDRVRRLRREAGRGPAGRGARGPRCRRRSAPDPALIAGLEPPDDAAATASRTTSRSSARWTSSRRSSTTPWPTARSRRPMRSPTCSRWAGGCCSRCRSPRSPRTSRRPRWRPCSRPRRRRSARPAASSPAATRSATRSPSTASRSSAPPTRTACSARAAPGRATRCC